MANVNNPSVDQPLTLLCQAIDDKNFILDDLFHVDIRSNFYVSHLKAAIKTAKTPGLDNVVADKLGIWKLETPMQILPKNEDTTIAIKKLLAAFNRDPQSVAVDLNPGLRLSRYFDEIPPDEHLHLIVRVPRGPETETKGKRDDPIDVSKQLLDKWNVPLPTNLSITDLGVYLDAPLAPGEKIPISDLEWRLLLRQDQNVAKHACYPDDLETLFTKNEDETATLLLHSLHETIIRSQPEMSGTEDSFHSFWDRNILDILFKCLDEPMWIRNSNRGTQTKSLRPDLGLFLRLACVFRGEEKKLTYTGKHPRQELVDKTRWVYDPAPYVIGYHAVGANITYVTIQCSTDVQGNEQIVVNDIISSDLSTRRGRIKNAATVIRLVRVLRTLERTVREDVDADMLTEMRDDGKSIEFFKTKIRKIYPERDKNRISFLKSIYDRLKTNKVPNVDHLTKYKISHPKYGSFVELEPRGIDRGPTTADDVKNAATSVLEALKVLHKSEPRILHRDIRWPNVMRSITNINRWFLIDWEDAAIGPTRGANHLNHETHSPRVFEDGHGMEVDIWAVGRLITTAQISNLPENLVAIGNRMVEGFIITAEQGLDELNSLSLT